MLLRKIRSFRSKSLFEKVWFVPSWFMLGASRAAILAVPFRRLAPWLGANAGTSPSLPLLDERQTRRALQIGRVVRLAAAYTPWESNCFPQAVTARFLLRWYGVPYALYFGLARASDCSDAMQAHAWVAAGRISVTGGSSFAQFTVVGSFVWPGAIGQPLG